MCIMDYHIDLNLSAQFWLWIGETFGAKKFVILVRTNPQFWHGLVKLLVRQDDHNFGYVGTELFYSQKGLRLHGILLIDNILQRILVLL